MSSSHTHIFHFPQIRVLITKEGKEYIAHALEFDLVGTGTSSEEAKKELGEAIIAQLEFAIKNNSLDTVFFRAPEEYIKKWEEVHKKEMLTVFGVLRKRPVASAEVMDMPKRICDRLKKVAVPA